jgi:hypothetical protein
MFWPLNPSADSVCIEDIAHALALKCRYTGHCTQFYSVAQHAVHVSEIVPTAALWGLMHDAAEAYLPDVAAPIKPRLTGFQAIEGRVLGVIAVWAGLSFPVPPEVHEADLLLLRTEHRDLMVPPPREWEVDKHYQPLSFRIDPQPPEVAERMFLDRWAQLTAR